MSETTANSDDEADVTKIEDVLEEAVESSEGDSVTLKAMLESQEGRSFGPLILLISLIAISPIGAIPGMSIVMGTILGLICVQILFGRSYPWLPNWIESKSFEREKVEKTKKKLLPWVKWIDKLIHPRWKFLTNSVAQKIIAAICIGLALSFYPMAFVPFGVMLPAGAVLLFSVALTTHDGVVAALGFLTTVVSLWFFWSLI